MRPGDSHPVETKLMNQNIDEIIAASKAKEAELRKSTEEILGPYCDALRGFIDSASEWKAAADQAFDLDLEQCRTDLFVARAVSLNILTNRALETAHEIARLLQAGAGTPAMVSWRALSEAKNTAMLIDLDVEGPAGFLWLHHGVIEQARMMEDDDAGESFADQAKQVLADAGLGYDRSQRDPWAKGVDGNLHANAVDRCMYVWRHRKYPPELDQDTRSKMEAAEVKMIRQSNALAHPTMHRSVVEYDPQLLMLAAILDPMAVMLAYKVAASELKLWETTQTVGEQFHLYPEGNDEAKTLSYIVMELYNHCREVFHEQFIKPSPPT